MAITCWPSVYATAEGRVVPFAALVARVRSPRAYASKTDIPRWAGATFRDGYRDLAHFKSASAIVIDIDTTTTRAQVVAAFGDLTGFAHTTWTPGRWRVALQLDRDVGQHEEEFARVHRAALEHAERYGLVPEHGQSSAHCFGLPALGGAAYDHIEFGGALFNVDDALYRFPKSVPLPEPTRGGRTDDGARRVERARKYLEKMPGAISGSRGHATTWMAAVALVRGFAIELEDALRLLIDVHNPICSPAWSEAELRHKVKQAYQRGRMPFGAIVERGRAA